MFTDHIVFVPTETLYAVLTAVAQSPLAERYSPEQLARWVYDVCYELALLKHFENKGNAMLEADLEAA